MGQSPSSTSRDDGDDDFWEFCSGGCLPSLRPRRVAPDATLAKEGGRARGSRGGRPGLLSRNPTRRGKRKIAAGALQSSPKGVVREATSAPGGDTISLAHTEQGRDAVHLDDSRIDELVGRNASDANLPPKAAEGKSLAVEGKSPAVESENPRLESDKYDRAKDPTNLVVSRPQGSAGAPSSQISQAQDPWAPSAADSNAGDANVPPKAFDEGGESPAAEGTAVEAGSLRIESGEYDRPLRVFEPREEHRAEPVVKDTADIVSPTQGFGGVSSVQVSQPQDRAPSAGGSEATFHESLDDAGCEKEEQLYKERERGNEGDGGDTSVYRRSDRSHSIPSICSQDADEVVTDTNDNSYIKEGASLELFISTASLPPRVKKRKETNLGQATDGDDATSQDLHDVVLVTDDRDLPNDLRNPSMLPEGVELPGDKHVIPDITDDSGDLALPSPVFTLKSIATNAADSSLEIHEDERYVEEGPMKQGQGNTGEGPGALPAPPAPQKVCQEGSGESSTENLWEDWVGSDLLSEIDGGEGADCDDVEPDRPVIFFDLDELLVESPEDSIIDKLAAKREGGKAKGRADSVLAWGALGMLLGSSAPTLLSRKCGARSYAKYLWDDGDDYPVEDDDPDGLIPSLSQDADGVVDGPNGEENKSAEPGDRSPSLSGVRYEEGDGFLSIPPLSETSDEFDDSNRSPFSPDGYRIGGQNKDGLVDFVIACGALAAIVGSPASKVVLSPRRSRGTRGLWGNDGAFDGITSLPLC